MGGWGCRGVCVGVWGERCVCVCVRFCKNRYKSTAKLRLFLGTMLWASPAENNL